MRTILNLVVSNGDMSHYKDLVIKLIKQAECIFPSGEGESKKTFVLNMLQIAFDKEKAKKVVKNFNWSCFIESILETPKKGDKL